MKPIWTCFSYSRSVALLSVLLTTGNLWADTAPLVPADSESLGNALMEDLGAGLLEDLQLPKLSAEQVPTRPLDSLPFGGERLFRKPSERWGEDFQAQRNSSPLAQIVSGMRKAQQLISQRDDTGQTIDVQQQVVADLDALIAALAQQCQACQNAGQSGQSTSQGSRRSQMKTSQSPPDAAAQAVGAGQAAAQDSTTRMEKGTAEVAALAEVDELLKELWGHLPDRIREQLLQSPADEFLPKYEMELEMYFRRLAEEGLEN